MMPALRRNLALAAWAIALLVVASSGAPVRAQTTAPEILGVRVGFGGRYKVGYWAPVNVEVRGGAQSAALRLQLELPDGEGEPTRLLYADAASVTAGKDPQQRTFSVGAGQTSPISTVAKFGRLDGSLQATLFDGETQVASRKFETDEAPDGQGLRTPLLSTQELVVNLGPSAGVEPHRSESGREGVVVDIASTDELPSDWLGYDGVDWLVITTSKPEQFDDLDGHLRLLALEQWVRLGGRLILSVGSGADDVLAPNAPLARFAPGKLRSTARLPSNAGIETYAGSREPLTWAGSDQRPPVTILENVRGSIEAYEGAQPEDLPLVIRSPLGLGQVVFVAFDLDLLARSQWAGRRSFMTRLLERSGAQEGRRGRNQDHDLSATLRTGLDEFRGVKPVSFAIVAVLIGVYLLAIGPFDYYIVRKLLDKPELTWLTFPAYVAIFCGLAWGLAYRFKGDQLRMNQIDLIDVDLEGRLVRGTSWANLFSPRAESFDFDLQPKTPVAGPTNGAGAALSWLGAPGGGVGGMDARGGTGLFSRPYEIWPGPGRLVDLPIQVWSSRGIIGRWSRELPAGPSSQLTETGSRASRLLLGIEGTIDNPFDVPLEECVVLYGDFAYVIGPLTAGQQVRINRDTRWQTVKSYFGTTAQVGFQAETKAWDEDTTDPTAALRVMMFYQAIDGYRYTQRMLNVYQRFVDLSSALAGGQAVFLGYGPLDQSAVALAPPDSVLSRADNQARAIYRIVAPVTRSAAAPAP
jgi:hypothetical protein